MILLAIDPGLDRCGWAVIKKKGSPRIIDFGRISTNKKSVLTLRVKKLGTEFANLIDRFCPDQIIIEEIFFSKNKKTMVMVAQSQGVLLSIGAQKGIGIEFLNPMQIKSILTGDGHADKKQIQKMISLEFKLSIPKELDDVSDAIAVGLAYCHLKKFL